MTELEWDQLENDLSRQRLLEQRDFRRHAEP